MSPRAAWRLERLGHTVYDYTAGKADWLAAGLPTERAEPRPARVIDAIDQTVVTCSPTTKIQQIADRLRDDRWGMSVVVNEQHIVLGRIRIERLERADPAATAEVVMEPGPVTVRAHADLQATRKRLRDRRVPSVLVTTPDGALLGLLAAADEPDDGSPTPV